MSVLITPSSLPVRPNRYVSTAAVTKVSTLIKMSALTGHCVLIDGPVGVGKSTAVIEAARAMKLTAVYVDMHGSFGAKDDLTRIWSAMTGLPAAGTGPQLREDIHKALKEHLFVLIIDDAHLLQKPALSTLMQLWNRNLAQTGKGFPLVFCGNHIEEVMERKLDSGYSRNGLYCDIKPLAGKSLDKTIKAMEPDLAGTDPQLLSDINMHRFKGEIRRWSQFLDFLAVYRSVTHGTGPLTTEEAEYVLAQMPGQRRAKKRANR